MAVVNKWLSISCLVVICLASSAFLAAELRAESHCQMTGVVSKMLIRATPEEVFDAIRTYRRSDATKRVVVDEKKGRCTIREKFAQLPILGDVDCTYEEIEVPYSRIDYQLVNSDKLKVFEGNWQMTPVDDGKSTLVKLTSYLDTAVNVPAKEFLTHLSAHEDIHKRLSFVKKIAEGEEVRDEAKSKEADAR